MHARSVGHAPPKSRQADVQQIWHLFWGENSRSTADSPCTEVLSLPPLTGIARGGPGTDQGPTRRFPTAERRTLLDRHPRAPLR